MTASAYTVPTDAPEADGTIAWHETTLVLVEVSASSETGIGYTYADPATAGLLQGVLAGAVAGHDAMDVPACWDAMRRAVRNLGREGIAACAISALWDLKAKLLGLPLCTLLGAARAAVPIYGSGGFTTYSDAQLREQLAGWVERDGCRWVKMKLGAHSEQDPHRVAAARAAIGGAELFVDVNGAFGPRRALFFTEFYARENGVTWFEEPVSSDDLSGLRMLRDRAPPGVDVAAGEYAYTPEYARTMLAAGAVDVMQVDASRCMGITGFLRAAALCDAFHTDLSGHCAPALHLHAAMAAPRLRHLEWFHDHVRIERMLFDGAPVPRDGLIAADPSRPGLGLEFRRANAARFAVH